jgi:ABC-type nitrate/sulfonate/bicarbonate transport system substrate-binding protein
MSEAAAWADANPDKVVAILAKDFKLDPALIAQTRRVFFPERINATQAQPWIDVTSKYAKFAPFRAEEMIDPGALRAGP